MALLFSVTGNLTNYYFHRYNVVTVTDYQMWHYKLKLIIESVVIQLSSQPP